MCVVEIFLIAVSLALDAFAVSVSSGIAVKGFSWRQAVKMGCYFGGFQFAMPVIGYLLGSSVSQYIETVDHWVAFALLANEYLFGHCGNVCRVTGAAHPVVLGKLSM